MNNGMFSRGFVKFARVFQRALVAVFVTLGLLAWTAPAGAHVTKIVIDKAKSESPAYGGKSFGNIGQYEKIVGQAYGELDPKDRRNAIIQDIQLAPRNSRGMVEYVATFSLSKPMDMSKASGVLLYDTVNRGNEVIANVFKSGDSSAEDFFASRGVVIVRSGWQADLPPNGRGGLSYTIQVPIAKNPDGSSITGPVLARFINMPPNTNTLAVTASLPMTALSYERPVSLDTTQATLTTHQSETLSGVIGGEKTVPSSDWAWADCAKTPFPGTPDPGKICMKNGFDPTLLYQLVFTAKDPLVTGVGLAAMRDILSFFRHADKDEQGTANPVAAKISYVVAHGTSQTGRIVRTFIEQGFNEDESGRIVWDGANENVAGRLNPVNVRFGIPGGGIGMYELQSEGVSSWAASPDKVRNHKAAGVLDRCLATKTCPKIFDTFGATELWNMKYSPNLVGTSGDKDIPLPENVRRYYFPGTPHFGGPGGFSVDSKPAQACTLAANPNPESETQRALILALVDWVVKGTPPPPSRYPTLAKGELVSASESAKGFPKIPGVASPAALMNPVLDYDLGPDFDYNDLTGAVLKQPPAIKHVIEGVVVKVNADGNETAGIPSVLLQAPLGTYTGWNVTANGFFKDSPCGFTGGYIPFARTKAERMASGDPRLSIEERYPTHDAYVAQVKAAADKAVHDHFLLQEDADRLVQQAAASDIASNKVSSK
jgi:hypothetical protein